MAESDFQLEPLVYAITALRTHFHHRKKVYAILRAAHPLPSTRKNVFVAGDMYLYHEEGNPRAVVAPDVFVVVGAPVHKRMSYKLWEEPKAPDFVLEVTSRSTRKEDQGRKREVYASLGVGEYWLFDPTGDYLAPRLQGFRLHGGEYRPLPSVAMVGGGVSLHSEVLGLDVRLDEEGRLRFHDPETGEDLPAHARTGGAEIAAAGRRRFGSTRKPRPIERPGPALEEAVAARRTTDARIAEFKARLGRAR